MTKMADLQHDTPTLAAFADRYFDHLRELFGRIERDEIAAFVQALLDARARGSRVFFIGNGGSATTASHFANDLAIGTKASARPFRVVSLTDNVATLTAIANDYGYAEVFTVQLKAYMEPNDVVVAISASGNSPNVVGAIRWANEHGAVTVGLTGFDGGQLRGLARVSLHVPTGAGEYGPVEDLHMIFDHLVSTYVRVVCSSEETTL
jgi:D-sedoheptulose 7-phosphate isomerase